MLIEGPVANVEAECERILRSLPEWFGVESALVEYVKDSARLPTFVVKESRQIVGFVSLRRHFVHSWEVSCIAVHRDRRGEGYGRTLLERAENWAAGEGAKLLQVKTLAESHPSPEYQQTRAFYTRMGYMPVEVLPTLWSASNPCLQMLKPVGSDNEEKYL